MPRNDPIGNVLEYDALGHYRFETGGLIFPAEAAGATLLAFRWTDATRVCVVERIKLQIVQTVGFTAATTMNLQTQVCRAWTVSDSAGAAFTPLGGNGRMRATMGNSLLGDGRIATVAAGLTKGTRTPDTTSLMFFPWLGAASVGVNYASHEWNADAASMHPLVLVQNEGLEVLNGNVAPAAGGAVWGVAIEWAEVNAF